MSLPFIPRARIEASNVATALRTLAADLRATTDSRQDRATVDESRRMAVGALTRLVDAIPVAWGMLDSPHGEFHMAALRQRGAAETGMVDADTCEVWAVSWEMFADADETAGAA
jgi:hypothetical protein